MGNESILFLFFSNIWNWTAFVLIVIYGLIVYNTSKDAKVLNTIPGFCTGIGVLLTFTILFINLQDGGFDFSNTNNSTSSLEDLVKRLASAFSTSIIGVFCSLIANYFVKWKISKIELEALEGAKRRHPQLMLQDVVDASNKNQASINDLITNIAAIQQSFEEKINGLFRTMTNSLQGSVAAIGRDALQEAQTSIQTTNNQLVEASLNLLKEHNQSLTDATSTNQERMEKIFESMAGLGELIKKQMEQTEEKATSSIGSIETGFQDSVQTMTSNFEGQATKLQTTFAKVNGELSNLSGNIEARMTQAESKANESIAKIEAGFANSVDTITSKFDSQTAQLQDVFDKVHGTMEGINENIQEQINTILKENLSNLTTSFDKIESMNETAQTNLRETTTKFADAVNQYEVSKGENENISTQIAEQLQSNESLRTDMVKLLEKWQELSSNVEKMQYRIGDIANTIAELNLLKKQIPHFNGNGQ